jgi:signal transduction histidine kinase
VVFLVQIAAFTGLVASTLRVSLDRLRALVRAKDEFVASVAHQLRTPLTGVFGLAEELRSGSLSLDEQETLELLGLVADQASEAAHVMDNLAVAARLEIDLVTVRPKPVVVEHVLQRVMQRLTDPPTVHGANVTVLADPDRLAQILRNLLSNALHHGARPVSIHAESDANGVEICVVDCGPGVSDPDRLFQPYQPALYGTGQPLALGLGLWVSHQLAALMGGDLRYRRQDDSTTIFALRLPQPT